MTTVAADRFAAIFATAAKPALPDPSEAHIAEIELQKPQPLQLAPPPAPFKIPDVPQLKCKFYRENRKDGRDVISSSDDDDDYVNALKSSARPKMLDSSKYKDNRITRKPAVGKLGDDKDAHLNPSASSTNSTQGVRMRCPEDSEDIDTVPHTPQLPLADVDSNKVVGHFCVLSHVSKFPYKYMKDDHDAVSKRFFAANKFYARKWDIYYLQPPESMLLHPFILLPLDQVLQLLNEISTAFEVNVSGPLAQFTLSFFDDKTPQPVFLGKSTSRDEYNELQNSIPPAREGHGICLDTASAKEKRTFEDFAAKCQSVRMADKKGKTKKTRKKVKEKLVAFREASSGLRRIQRYFGLRPPKEQHIAAVQSLSWEDQKTLRVEQAHESGAVFEPLHLVKTVTFPFEKDVVFISFDVEANEHAHHLITEIGISTLDTDDLKHISPGPGGSNWIKQIRSRHFRIQERAHMRNKTFVSGNPNGFLFGSSEFVPLRDIADEVDKCFAFPFSAGFQHDGTKRLGSLSNQRGSKDRRIVLLGHAVQTDIDFLSKLGSKIFTPSLNVYPPVPKHPILNSIEEALDIEILYKVLKKEENARSLGSVMADLGRDAWILHNGGNDARYTMECLVGMAIKARLEDDEKMSQEQKEKEKVAREVEDANMKWQVQGADGWTNDAGEKTYANMDNKAEAEALNAKFLDPGRTATSAVSTAPPGRGRHYGSDNELDEMSDEEVKPVMSRGRTSSGPEWFDPLVRASEEKLKLDGGDDDDESDFEM